MATVNQDAQHVRDVVAELQMLRKLAILDLSDRGFSQGDIADVLGGQSIHHQQDVPERHPEAQGKCK